MSKATVFLLLLFAWLTESILFTPYDFDIITRGIAALHGNVSPLNYHYNPKNACQVLSDVADQQLKWIRNSNINPPSLRKDYLKVVRKIKKVRSTNFFFTKYFRFSSSLKKIVSPFYCIP
ncbi:hypothetical protein D917_09029 [Trichinella nativa]|uniref:Uncharacterized protein n=1 Tax=Trichinella nativa TaxID=6335 RepID=A0A1Y3EN49_9BILA|nr:hypothetical protein D917_09029 [Trichinella nativa]